MKQERGINSPAAQSEPWLALLQLAAAQPDANLIVRSAVAIAEVPGPLVLAGVGRWLRLGVEGESHLHLDRRAIAGLRFLAPRDRNAHVCVVGHRGELICRIAFRKTNPARTPYRVERLRELFLRFAPIRCFPSCQSSA